MPPVDFVHVDCMSIHVCMGTCVVVVVVAVEANRLTLGTYSGNCLETHTQGALGGG